MQVLQAHGKQQGDKFEALEGELRMVKRRLKEVLKERVSMFAEYSIY